MVSTTQRGNYYKKKTQRYYQNLGYTVELCEFITTRPISKNKVIYEKRDVFASDLIATNEKEILFINSKHFTSEKSKQVQIKQAEKKYSYFKIPNYAKKLLVFWELRNKIPDIIEVKI